MMNETLQEFVDSRGVSMRVEREAGVIRGVKILGVESRNGRTYLADALIEAAPLYEDIKVNVNHPKGNPLSPRDYQDRIGAIRNVTVRAAEGLFGDFHFNPKHALAEQLIWDAGHAPENVGFSHNVQARTTRRGDRTVVEAITKVQSVDLVADPATTRGLFEAKGPTGDAVSANSPAGSKDDSGRILIEELSAEMLRRRRPDLVDCLLKEQQAELHSLRAEVDRLEAAGAVRQRRLAVRQILAEFHLPDPDTAEGWARSVVGERFVESLLAAPDEEAVRRLVEERAALVRSAGESHFGAGRSAFGPVSRDQNEIHGRSPADAKAFAATIT
jgi:hypothetical protein